MLIFDKYEHFTQYINTFKKYSTYNIGKYQLYLLSNKLRQNQISTEADILSSKSDHKN